MFKPFESLKEVSLGAAARLNLNDTEVKELQEKVISEFAYLRDVTLGFNLLVLLLFMTWLCCCYQISKQELVNARKADRNLVIAKIEEALIAAGCQLQKIDEAAGRRMQRIEDSQKRAEKRRHDAQNWLNLKLMGLIVSVYALEHQLH